MNTSDESLHPLVAKLKSIAQLSDEEIGAVEKLPARIVKLVSGEALVREGDRPTHSCLVLEGMTSTFNITSLGHKQISAFHVAGDMPDLQSLHLERFDSTIIAETPSKVAFIEHAAIRRLSIEYPRVGATLWRNTLIDAATLRQWVTNVGRRNAYTRTAHLFCEMLVRLDAVGLADGNSCRFPISQVRLSDALGMSWVHTNRTVTKLRGDGLIALSRGKLAALDWDGLTEAGDFDPFYLHIQKASSLGTAA